MSHTSRIVVLVDMDCFYCQVEEKLNPELKGTPVAVVQYNEWRGGGIIAVNYEARAKGVTRHMRGNDAKEVCPDINLVKVPQIRGKADLNKYRTAGKDVADVLQTFTPILERASVDEAYLDLTEVVENRIKQNGCKISIEQLPNSFVVGSEITDFVNKFGDDKICDESKLRLLVGGVITEEMRAKVYEVTGIVTGCPIHKLGLLLHSFQSFIGYRCSAGVAHNKILAKLVCGLHKPNKQTLLPQDAVPLLYKDLPVKKIKGFGGKFGDEISQILNIKNMGELSQFSEKELARIFDEKTANWLYNIARGIDSEPVTVRLISKSIGCSKNFLGKSMLVSQESVEHWLNELVSELSERLQKDLEENDRKAKNMTVNFSQIIDKSNTVTASRTCQIHSYDHSRLIEKAMDVLNKNCRKNDGTFKITHLGFSLGNFEDVKNVRSITSFFKNMEQNSAKISENSKVVNETKIGKLAKSLSASDQAKLLETSKFSEESDSDDETSSIFSTSTISDDKNMQENVVYFEDVKPESAIDQTFPDYECKNETNANLSSSSVDSITPEICNNTELNIESSRAPSSSFFEKFFSEQNNRREFDTSKIFEENSDTDISNNDKIETDLEMEISVKSQEKLAITNDFCTYSPIKNPDSPLKNLMSNKEICPECGKHIPIEEITSHMDYHLAIKIVKSEAHLYKSLRSESPVKNRTKDSKSSTKKIKRKSNEKSDSVVPISKFFSTKEDIPVEDSEICTECNKRIKIEDVPSHLDYHAAKKLHLELNSQSIKPKSPVKIKTDAKKNDKKTKIVSGDMNITSFFKKC